MNGFAAAPGQVAGQAAGQVAEPTTRVTVTVTFMRMERPPVDPPPPLPADSSLVLVPRATPAFYRYLYDTVGAPHLWWLRRTEPPKRLEALLSHPAVGLFVLYRKAEPAGFFELDGRRGHDINLSYFGLMPHAVGGGFGYAFLRSALDKAWSFSPPGVTVNTCTADHPRALPTYLRAGFRPTRSVQEVWDIPVRLGLEIPEHLRA